MDKVSFCIITKAKQNFFYPSTIVTVKIEIPIFNLFFKQNKKSKCEFIKPFINFKEIRKQLARRNR